MFRCGLACFAMLLGYASAFGVTSRPVRPLLSSACGRPGIAIRCGFEVESLDEKALGELGVMNWPNLEKRTNEFSKSATADELLMVYVKAGSATLTDSAESATVSEGQIVMVSDGEVRWSEVAEGGVTLLSVVTATESDGDVVDDGIADENNALKANIAKSLTGSTRGFSKEFRDASATEAEEETSLTEYAGLLAAGVLSGVLLSNGLKLFLEG